MRRQRKPGPLTMPIRSRSVAYDSLCSPWLLSPLGLDDARRDEEQQLVVRVLRTLPPEQVSEQRDVAEHRGLVLVDEFLALVDAADDGGLTVLHEHDRLRRLRVDG